MTDGRTIWQMKDAAWWRREWIVILGEEFGADGPAVVDWLECEAKLQNDGGYVKAGRRTIARGAFVELVTVGHVLSRAVTLGLLENWEELDGRFRCRISWWEADQRRGGAAKRKADQRDRESVNTGDCADESRSVTPSHAESQNVTLRGEERREELPTSDEVGSRARPRRRVDQSVPPVDLSTDLIERLPGVLDVLVGAWHLRGGVTPQPRGVGLAMLRNPGADHLAVARRLNHWLTAGKGQTAKCADIAARFGDWVSDEVAGARPTPGTNRPAAGRESASDLLRAMPGGAA